MGRVRAPQGRPTGPDVKDCVPVIRRQHVKTSGDVKVTFVLDDDVHDGAVSVVGDFNDWRPGTHVLRRRSNGTRSAAVTVAAGSAVRFRYLGDGGRWFDDPGADAHDRDGGLLYC